MKEQNTENVTQEEEVLTQEEEAQPNPPKKKGKTLAIIICAIILLAAAVSFFVITTKNAREEEQRKKAERLNEILTSETFVDGVSVGGIDISGLTTEEAKELLEEKNSELVGDIEIIVDCGDYQKKLTTKNIGITADLDDVLAEALTAAHRSTYEEAEEALAEIAANGKDYEVTLVANSKKVKSVVAAIAKKVDVSAKNATIKLGSDGIEYVSEVEGKELNQKSLISTIKKNVKKGDFSTIEAEIETTEPEITKADIKTTYVKLGSCTTSYGSSNSNRKFNVEKAAKLVNGVVVDPGETFSMNDTIGDRTYANGWKGAAAIVRGSTETQAGGGVCQVSSTMYNAVVKSDLEIVYRRNHSSKVGYVPAGLDATINTGTIDFKWKNNTDKPVLIRASANGSSLTVSIYGQAFQTDEYDEIKLSASYTGTSSSGAMNYQSYKIYYKDGKKVKSEKLATSSYRPYN